MCLRVWLRVGWALLRFRRPRLWVVEGLVDGILSACNCYVYLLLWELVLFFSGVGIIPKFGAFLGIDGLDFALVLGWFGLLFCVLGLLFC